jgi:hypothetical protein
MSVDIVRVVKFKSYMCWISSSFRKRKKREVYREKFFECSHFEDKKEELGESH